MNTYFALFLIATFASLVLTPLVRRLCERFKLLDVPVDGRRMHSKAVPRLGGVAIYLACVIALSTLPFVDNLLTQTLRVFTPEIFVALIPATLVLFFGIYDDLRGTNATVKFTALGIDCHALFHPGRSYRGLVDTFLRPCSIAGNCFIRGNGFLAGGYCQRIQFDRRHGWTGIRSCVVLVACDPGNLICTGSTHDDCFLARALRSVGWISALQLQPGLDIPGRLGSAFCRLHPGVVVGAWITESDYDGSGCDSHSGVWPAGRRYGGDDRPATHQR